MKNPGRHAVTALVCVCLLAAIGPTVFRNTPLGAIHRNSLAYWSAYYLPKGQWIADLRTIKAAVVYLYESHYDSLGVPAEVARNRPPNPAGTNFPSVTNPTPDPA